TAKLQLQPGVILELHASKFDESRHKIMKLRPGGVRLIDEKQFFGTDGGLPRTQLDSAAITIGDSRIVLDVSGMFEPWVTSPSTRDFKLQRYDGGWVLTGLFSDAAGAYVARWRILSGTAFREILTDDEKIMAELFP